MDQICIFRTTRGTIQDYGNSGFQCCWDFKENRFNIDIWGKRYLSRFYIRVFRNLSVLLFICLDASACWEPKLQNWSIFCHGLFVFFGSFVCKIFLCLTTMFWTAFATSALLVSFFLGKVFTSGRYYDVPKFLSIALLLLLFKICRPWCRPKEVYNVEIKLFALPCNVRPHSVTPAEYIVNMRFTQL